MSTNVANFTIGVDLGDRQNVVCVLDASGEVVKIFKVSNTKKAMHKSFEKYSGSLVAIETGTHSGWVSRLLEELGCEVLVGNTRKLRAIWQDPVKTDYRDAEMLARIARVDPKLLEPIQHRSEQSQEDLVLIQSRDMLVKSRSSLINHVRGIVKSFGERIPSCSAPSFHKKAYEHVPERLKFALFPLIEQIESLTKRIREYEQKIAEVSQKSYPETDVLRQVPGVGPITALAFILTLEDSSRFHKSRDVGPFLGMVPKRDQSGDMDKQLRITKCGNKDLRRLLINAAHYILGPFGPDSELKRHGERISQRGGKISKKRAIVAVARKLAVLLHRLWVTGEEYDPFYNQSVVRQAA
ncbi:transposase IS116/IS110/IS902 family protein [Desulfonatronospira thiodismutans ASO3-1]|uniref:Transposase IS116/IS110/IS902 family protein n=1 Tax=Desulfonatronospira thiodismutans ASO3-1 TaxID=555779 RepID=D6STX0_9BACT|nr:IS110 family transposase [Desulfonatronospira thiodismutans]EFI34136.1 transposase IS116/IS110/IS902 family protein [Desulfonatronospira thiodismutans ASO3-1]